MTRTYTETEWSGKGYELITGSRSTQKNSYGQSLYTEGQVRKRSSYSSPSRSSYDDGNSAALFAATSYVYDTGSSYNSGGSYDSGSSSCDCGGGGGCD